MYGEASGGKFFDGPVLLNALITVGDNTSPTSEFGVDFNWSIRAAFLRDDLVDANIHPEVGDVLLYQESYFEIDNTNIKQFFAGKDPDYPYAQNPLNPGLENFGYNVEIVKENLDKLESIEYERYYISLFDNLSMLILWIKYRRCLDDK